MFDVFEKNESEVRSYCRKYPVIFDKGLNSELYSVDGRRYIDFLAVAVRFNEEEHNRFLAMFGKSGVYARSVFLKAHFFGQPFKVLKVDKTLVDYYTKLSDFHAQFRAVGTNYNQVVKELRLHFSEKKAMALLYKLEQHTVELVKLSRRIVELSREMEAKWSQKSV